MEREDTQTITITLAAAVPQYTHRIREAAIEVVQGEDTGMVVVVAAAEEVGGDEDEDGGHTNNVTHSIFRTNTMCRPHGGLTTRSKRVVAAAARSCDRCMNNCCGQDIVSHDKSGRFFSEKTFGDMERTAPP